MALPCANHVAVIAEAGVNHNGSLGMAQDMIRAAADAGADFVKFQTFIAEKSLRSDVRKARYQAENTGEGGTMLEMVKKFELPLDAFATLAKTAADHGIAFVSTPFDIESVAVLADLDIPFLKIPSGEITNPFLMLEMARHQKPIVMSTGMATLAEIEEALGVVAFGYLGGSLSEASPAAFAAARSSGEGRRLLEKNVTILHCTTNYPAPAQDVNLKAMQTIRQAFGLPVGYSDHTLGISVALAAVGMGACAIEKHFTLDRSLPGPDHKASLTPDELASLCREIRTVTTALGDGDKRPMPSEMEVRSLVRKSLVAAAPIATNAKITLAAMTAKRPGTGVSPMDFWRYVGKTASRDMAADDNFAEDDL